MATVFEQAIGGIDGSNTDFQTPTNFVAGSLRHVLNGQVKDPAGTDGLIEGTSPNFELKEAPLPGDRVDVIYDDGRATDAMRFNVQTTARVITFKGSPPSSLFQFVQGNTEPSLEFTLLDEDLQPVDITGYSFAFRFARADDTVQKNAAADAVVITNAAVGECRYTWAADDLDTPGYYVGELQITNVAGRVQTIPEFLRFKVRPRVGG